MKKRLVLITAALLGAAFAFSQPVLNPVNGNHYELVTAPLNWNAARAAAELRTFQGVNGHLVTITNGQEQEFMVQTFGASMREKYTGGFEVDMVWQWVTGEPFSFSNWAPGEPNGGGVINFHGANSLGSWNDVPTFEVLGYFVEYETGFALTLNKSSVAGQNFVQGTISQSPVATNTTYTTYDNSSLVTTPASVTVLANNPSAIFAIQVTAVNSPINATIYARRGALTMSKPLALIPLIPTAIAFTPNPATGGNEVSCRIVVNGVAGPSGRVIAVFDSSPYTTMPSTVTVPPGGTQVIFPITTTSVPSPQAIVVTARVSAGEKTAVLRLNPAP